MTLDELGNTQSLSSLESLDLGELGEVLFYEFSNADLSLLVDGLLNIAIQDDTPIDWVRFAWLIPAGIPGDFDSDGNVDGADFLQWQRDSAVGDLADWQTHYGTPASLATASGAVPEPSTLALAASIMFVIAFGRRNTNHRFPEKFQEQVLIGWTNLCNATNDTWR